MLRTALLTATCHGNVLGMDAVQEVLLFPAMKPQEQAPALPAAAPTNATPGTSASRALGSERPFELTVHGRLCLGPVRRSGRGQVETQLLCALHCQKNGIACFVVLKCTALAQQTHRRVRGCHGRDHRAADGAQHALVAPNSF